MSKIRAIKSVLAGMLAGTMVFSAASVFPTGTFTQELDANAAGACTINTNKLYQRIRGFGGMNHPEWQSYNAHSDPLHPSTGFCLYRASSLRCSHLCKQILTQRHQEPGVVPEPSVVQVVW